MNLWRCALGGLLLVSAGSCAGTPLRYYQARVSEAEVESAARQLDASLAVSSFAVDEAYDDQRIVYRTSPHRFDYYHFHRWSSNPGELVSVVLREAFRKSGHFAHVVGGFDARADFVLHGRVVALEEVDTSDDQWQVHVAVELTLREGATGHVLWSTRVDEHQAITQQTPEGVAVGAGRALTRVARVTAPAIASAASQAMARW